MSKGIASKRIPLTDSTWEALRDFTNGLGTTYDEAVQLLLNAVVKHGENPLMAGHRLRTDELPPASSGKKLVERLKDVKLTAEDLEDLDRMIERRRERARE